MHSNLSEEDGSSTGTVNLTRTLDHIKLQETKLLTKWNTHTIFYDRNYQEVLEITEITESKVEKAINALMSSKSQGPDNIHPKYLKETKD